MAGLLYKEDFDAARDRLQTWWDGGDIGRPAIQLSIPRLTMIQWTPGAGQPDPSQPKRWPMHHKALDAGKKLILGANRDEMLALKKEFGKQFKNIMLAMWASSRPEADEILKFASD